MNLPAFTDHNHLTRTSDQCCYWQAELFADAVRIYCPEPVTCVASATAVANTSVTVVPNTLTAGQPAIILVTPQASGSHLLAQKSVLYCEAMFSRVRSLSASRHLDAIAVPHKQHPWTSEVKADLPALLRSTPVCLATQDTQA